MVRVSARASRLSRNRLRLVACVRWNHCFLPASRVRNFVLRTLWRETPMLPFPSSTLAATTSPNGFLGASRDVGPKAPPGIHRSDIPGTTTQKRATLTNDRPTDRVLPTGRTGLRDKHAADRVHRELYQYRRVETHERYARKVGANRRKANGNFPGTVRYGVAAVGEDVRAESPKNLESRGRCKRCRFTHGGSERPPLFARSQPRGPPYEDWFHETPRARPARLLRTTIEGEEEGQRQRDRKKQRRSHGEKEKERDGYTCTEGKRVFGRKRTSGGGRRAREGRGGRDARSSVWRAGSWSVGPVLRREACSSKREEVLLLRQSLRGSQRAAKRDAGLDAMHTNPSLTSVD